FIAIYYASSGEYIADSQQTPLSDIEITGHLSSILKISQIQPTMAWGDMDGDGNEDLVLANGKLYLIRSLGAGSWELELDYFEDINRGTRLYRNPQLVDFDLDGDFDLIMSEESNKLPGLFYWVNTGSAASPNWEFRRQDLVNLRTEGSGLVKNSTFLHYNNYTLFTIGHGEFLNETVSMIALNNYSDTIHFFEADLESQNSFIVGINPYLARVDMNLRPLSILGTEDKNYGYRILKTWDTEYELAQWTQAITATDLDGDGKRELIVGDFDNNLYVFEHLANNTYKRAYRSFDLSQQITTTESPYVAELLEGVSASFIRFEWQHVEQVIGGMDLDGDGFQEFAALSGLTLYLFEHTGRDDSYQLIWSINLSDTGWASVFDYLQLTSFTALAPSADANYNGKDELLAAVGPFLFIFEGQADNAISEVFMNPSLEDMFSIGSKYVLPENGLLHHFVTYDGSFDLEITQLYVGDVIKDTPEKEILIVGVNKTSWGHEHGFGMIMRHQGVSFIHVADLPREATWLNPIYDLTVDDQDYDGQPEILLGHAHGVDSWEVRLNQPVGSFSSPSDAFSLIRQSILSGSLNYPNVQSSEALFEPFNKMPSPRETEVIALSRALGSPSDTSYLPKGALVQAFVGSKNETTGRLRWAYSTDNGSTWQYEGLVNNTISPDFANDSDPCLFQDQTGHLWLAWTRIWDTGTVTSNITLVGYSASNADPWVYKTVVRSGDSPTNFYGSSSIFANSTSKDWISISYLDKINNRIGIRSYNDSTQALTSEYLVPILDGSAYTVHSCDAIYQDHGPGNGSILLAFAGRKSSELRIDNDIWVLTATWNNVKKEYNWSLFPIRVTGESTGEAYPDLAQLKSADGTVMLTFEIEGTIVACYSKTGGESWSEPEELLTLPDFIIYRYFPALGISFATWNRNPNVIFSEIEVRNPTIAALPSGGFVYSYAMSYSAYLLEKLPLDVNTISGAAAEYATGAMYQYQLIPFTTPEAIADYYGSLSGQPASYTTTVGYYLLQTVAQSLFSIASNITNSLPATTSGFLTSYLSTSTGDLYNAVTDGTYYNILTRTNFAEYWKDFDFLKAERIDVGDTDGDARREIAIYSGNRAYINEIAHSQPNSMSYRQVWVSSDLGTLNDLTIYDANGNGFEELFVSAEGGNVFAFEIANLDLPRALLQFVNSRQFVNNSWAPQSERRWPMLASFDADGDGLDELVFSELGNGYSNLTIFRGASITNDSLIIKKRLDGALIAMDYRDVTFDGFPDLAYGTDQGEYGVIDVYYSLITSSIVFAYQNQSLNEPLKSLQFAYRASENLWALLVVGYSQAVLVPAQGTGIIWEVPNFNGTALIGGTLGDFGVSPSETTDAVIVDVLGNIYLLDLGNGNIVETITAYSSSSPQDIIFSVAQLNEDGVADLLLA
ncbi:MAG: sialidase family protein, partial [Candidatus Hodarchaeales archaeon]